jgi:hypothetical protein
VTLPSSDNKILTQMLERLFAAMVNGPAMNCRPHSSRQRIDLTQLARLRDQSPGEILLSLMGDARAATITGKVPPPKRAPRVNFGGRFKDPAEDPDLTDEERAAIRAWQDQQSTLTKLRLMTGDAKIYEQDTGVHVLSVGFPLLSLPPGTFGGNRGLATRRVMAPIAFVPVNVVVQSGAKMGVELSCRGDGTDLIVPNASLLAWLEQQTGVAPKELFADDEGEDPWREICELVKHVGTLVDVAPPAIFDPAKRPETLALAPAPKADEDEAGRSIITTAVLGLFPLANQGLLRDSQAMAAGEALTGPVRSFVQVGERFESASPAQPAETPHAVGGRRNFNEDRFVAAADPCQARAVRLARTCRGMVIHGPPGTGKSQTITNIIGDHLMRGQRVLFVCDKRTALDVVANRLDHIGIGNLCAVIHDPQRDQRELYRSVREQLDTLAESRSDEKAEKKLAKIDEEMTAIHAELTRYHTSLMAADPQSGTSFHELVGQWLGISEDSEIQFDAATLADVRPAELEKQESPIHEILQRGTSVEFASNPWRQAAGIGLDSFLARPMNDFRAAMQKCGADAAAADATIDPSIPPFSATGDLKSIAEARLKLADQLEQVMKAPPAAAAAKWIAEPPEAVERMRRRLAEHAGLTQLMQSAPLDAELSLATAASLPTVPQINQDLISLTAYLECARKWYAFLAFGRKREASKVLMKFGMRLGPENAERASAHLNALRARLALQLLNNEITASGPSAGLASDEILGASLISHSRLLDLISEASSLGVRDDVASVLSTSAGGQPLLKGLRLSPSRAATLIQLEQTLGSSKLFDAAWTAAFSAKFRAGDVALATVQKLAETLDTLEGVLRVRAGLSQLSAPVANATSQLVEQNADPESGIGLLRRSVVALEIARRLRDDPQLQGIDAQRMKTRFDRFRTLEKQKRDAVQAAIMHRWTSKQRERLLVGTESRLNGTGADIRRRLTMRGERAMRLRQVIAVGQKIEGGDPLFDLRPVWMASPETVAQIFPRLPLFDAVVFDEASQCRLEEALPVLTRGHRVVIAGDPKQLPPTRFFESALVASDEEELDTDQDLFEAQQGATEDLLAAALGLDIQQSYLDVHYRSRNADLIGFSNEYFYGSRLQAIPGHPSNRREVAPISLEHVGGVYADRTNDKEADRICELVRELLKGSRPPSIGVACFNLSQRDLIVEKLDNLAEEDEAFGRKLAAARERIGEGSFEGLFVKNLENVQGDERDHVIISTTYGPDPNGKFRRNFGPLGREGGGRRLNVLVTRAREQVHVITSIPESAYRALPPVPQGQQAGGAWLVFAYLAYAENLSRKYESDNKEIDSTTTAAEPRLNVRPTQCPSSFAEALARRFIETRRAGSDVYWGNDGFGIDLAMHQPGHEQDVTIGVLCDTSRFTGAGDPVEWDIFRTGIHESQGWQIHRVWTPSFFRDPSGQSETILRESARAEETSQEK